MEQFELQNVVVPAKLVKMIMEYLDKKPHGEVKILSGGMSQAIQNTIEFDVKPIQKPSDD